MGIKVFPRPAAQSSGPVTAQPAATPQPAQRRNPSFNSSPQSNRVSRRASIIVSDTQSNTSRPNSHHGKKKVSAPHRAETSSLNGSFAPSGQEDCIMPAQKRTSNFFSADPREAMMVVQKRNRRNVNEETKPKPSTRVEPAPRMPPYAVSTPRSLTKFPMGGSAPKERAHKVPSQNQNRESKEMTFSTHRRVVETSARHGHIGYDLAGDDSNNHRGIRIARPQTAPAKEAVRGLRRFHNVTDDKALIDWVDAPKPAVPRIQAKQEPRPYDTTFNRSPFAPASARGQRPVSALNRVGHKSTIKQRSLTTGDHALIS